MKKLLILITILASIYANLIAQDKYSSSSGKYELDYPVDWKQIPVNEVEKKYNSFNKSFKVSDIVKYDAGFQRRLSRKWFTYPYVLINISETGRLNEQDIKKMVGSFEKEVQNLSDNKSIRGIIRKLKTNDVFYDEKRNRLISVIGAKAILGNIECLMIMNLTSFGSINMFFYTTPNRWESDYKDFMDLADGLIIAKQVEYNTNDEEKGIKSSKITNINNDTLIDNNDLKGLISINEILYPILNFLFFLIPLLLILILLYRVNIGSEVAKFTSNNKWYVAAITCILLSFAQVLIGGVIILPIILNTVLFFPLIFFLDYLKKSNSLKSFTSNKTNDELPKIISSTDEDLSNKLSVTEQQSTRLISEDPIGFDEIISIHGENNTRPNSQLSLTITDNNMENQESKMSENASETEQKSKSEFSSENDFLEQKISNEQKCYCCGTQVELNEEEILLKKYKCPNCYTENIAKTVEMIAKKYDNLEIKEELSVGMIILCFLMPCVGVIVAGVYFSREEKKKAGTAILSAFIGLALGMVLRLLSRAR